MYERDKEYPKMTIEQLSSLVEIGKQTLKMYLCRTEFRHIQTLYKDNKLYYCNINSYDIERFKKLTLSRKGNIARKQIRRALNSDII